MVQTCMTDINKLWRKHIEGKCVHECNDGGICMKCGRLGTSIPAYDEDPAVFMRCVLKFQLHINPCDCWPPGNDRTHIEDECVPNELGIYAVMKYALKMKGVDVDD